MTFIVDGTKGGTFPSWTTSTRPASPAVGQMGYNTTTGNFDAYTANGWVTVLPSAAGSTTQLPSSAMPTGSVLQVVYGAVGAQATTASGTPVDTGLTATITPKFSTSKIAVITSMNGVFVNAVSGGFTNFRLQRDSATLNNFGYVVGYLDGSPGSGGNRGSSASFQYLDTPVTTSATVYKVQFWALNGATIDVQRDNQAVSSIILMEIAG